MLKRRYFKLLQIIPKHFFRPSIKNRNFTPRKKLKRNYGKIYMKLTHSNFFMTGTREVKIQNRGINRRIKKTRVYKTKTVLKYSAGLIPKLTGKQRRQVYARNIVTAKFIKELREKSFFIHDIILNSQKTLTAFRSLIRYFRRYKIRYRKLIVPYKKPHGFTRPKKARRL